MAKFTVTYVHTVEITYEALVEADTPEEAKRRLEDEMDFISEEEIETQGLSVEVQNVEEIDDMEDN